MKNKVAPSIFAADFYNLSDAVKKMENAGVDFIHYDIMDNHFVPNISFGIKMVNDIQSHTSLAADIHLMIDLEYHFDKFLKLPAELLTIHLESTNKNILYYLNKIRDSGKKAGLSIKPGTPITSVFPFINDVDNFLIMSVEPGFSGQKFIPQVIDKIKQLRKAIGNAKVDIQVDGGVCRENYQEIIRAGANFLVIGTAFFKDTNVKEWVHHIQNFNTIVSSQYPHSEYVL